MRIFHVYRLSARLLPQLPPTIGYRLCEQLSVLAPLTPAWPRIQANLQQVLPHATESHRRRLGRRIVANLLKGYYELFRLHSQTPADRASLVDIRGLANLETALAGGKGVIIAMPHMGSLSLAAEPVAALVKTPLMVAAEQLRDPDIHALMRSLRQQGDVEVVEIGPTIARTITRRLRAGHIVVLPCDRTVADATVDVMFFGKSARVPSGPAMLALRTGAPIMTAFSYRLPDNRSVVVIDPPIVLERRTELGVDVGRIMQAVLRIFETYIRRDPAQWLLTEPVWDTA